MLNYNLVEEIETELTYAANEKDILTPSGMNIDANACTGLAFDNYDHFVGTLTGEDTLHDIVGIAYETVKLDNAIKTKKWLKPSEQIIHHLNGKYSMGKTWR